MCVTAPWRILRALLWLGQSAPFGWLVLQRLVMVRAGHRGACGANRAVALRDSDCRPCGVDRTTVDGADCCRGLCPAVLDEPGTRALSIRGQALHGRCPLRIATPGSRCLGDRGRRLSRPSAPTMGLVDCSGRRSLVCQRCVARYSCLRDLSVCRHSGDATADVLREWFSDRWIDLARLIWSSLSDIHPLHASTARTCDRSGALNCFRLPWG